MNVRPFLSSNSLPLFPISYCPFCLALRPLALFMLHSSFQHDSSTQYLLMFSPWTIITQLGHPLTHKFLFSFVIQTRYQTPDSQLRIHSNWLYPWLRSGTSNVSSFFNLEPDHPYNTANLFHCISTYSTLVCVTYLPFYLVTSSPTFLILPSTSPPKI